MSTWLQSVVRTAVQLAWGVVASWLVAHNLPVPDDVTNWVTNVAVGLVMLVVVAALRWLETRDVASPLGRVARFLARILMLGAANKQPVYVKAVKR